MDDGSDVIRIGSRGSPLGEAMRFANRRSGASTAFRQPARGRSMQLFPLGLPDPFTHRLQTLDLIQIVRNALR